ncbi:Toxoplasma gondii family C protein [Toxoplasma gondii RUB]|uniref:Toxoplasma gondii family C protein n=6 Tax=Toxoplasma gondii TaxID=5811 RepID=A0A086LJ76_TOXGO|nr:Toxoplasma gondii family C protein [Toxoplasma gondii p89]KFG44853.1 toxoplasma gondii family C protein [Toxoplasma gondii GAB2-2007-GAL-DOM2]KFG56694.1 Toxoplasma gondii family C protein [Toxoplasma gondii RUB]PUA83368.1 Toxoplasma gondii family C protein [Toxoplasma gondii TgCATBr9]RQX74259.1 Toxoplasma gondii family C protein [Toxoplasma gondii CAST]
MESMVEKKRSGFSTGWHLPSQLKARRGPLFHHDSPILLFSVVLPLMVLAPLVSLDCFACRVCTALADSVSGRETDTDWSDTYRWTETGDSTTVEGSGGVTEVKKGNPTEGISGAIEAEDRTTVEGSGGATEVYGGAAEVYDGAVEVYGGAAEENYTSVGNLIESHAVEPLRERSGNPSVAAHVSGIRHSGRARPVVASGILASLVLSVLLGAIFLNPGRKVHKATTPAPSRV